MREQFGKDHHGQKPLEKVHIVKISSFDLLVWGFASLTFPLMVFFFFLATPNSKIMILILAICVTQDLSNFPEKGASPQNYNEND